MNTVIVVYEAKNKNTEELLAVLRRHALTLRKENLLTEMPELLLNAGGGFFLEILEWKSEEASRMAHENPEVQKIWGELEQAAHFRALGSLPEALLQQPFAKFQPAFPAPARLTTYADNMLGAKNFESLVAFYANCFGLENKPGPGFAMLEDPESRQKLCITDGASVSRMSPGVATKDLAKTTAKITELGGKVGKHWEYAYMQGANCHDPEGNEILVWKLKGEK